MISSDEFIHYDESFENAHEDYLKNSQPYKKIMSSDNML